MRFKAVYFATAFTVFMGGCASIHPALPSTAKADASIGYVAGQFTRIKSRGYAFVLRSMDSGKEFVMALGEDTSIPSEVRDQTVAIPVPPGTYAVVQWITYATMTKEVSSRQSVTNEQLSKPFTVGPGQVVHLGSHDISEASQRNYPNFSWQYRIQPRPVSEGAVKQAFAQGYPNLAGQPFRCHLCVDTVK